MTRFLSIARPLSVAGGLMLMGVAPAFAEGDTAHGEAVFKRCANCHSLKPAENKIGPSLAGIIGKTAGGVAGFHYSDALKNSGLVWDEATLDAFLAAPAKKVPGNKMAVGVANDKDRADVISYLKGK